MVIGRTLIAATVVACLAASPCVKADDPAATYPVKPVRIIIGPTANFTDIVTRQLAHRLHEVWQQPVVVENRASGMMGAAAVAKSAPDGYTLLVSDRTWRAVAQSLYKELPYDPDKDFTQIALVASTPNILLAHPSIPAANVEELVAYAKTQQLPLSYATAGMGTATHLPGEQLKQLAGIDLTAVHYKGGGAAMNAMLIGEVKIGFNPVALALPHLRAGKVKAFVITSKKRFAGSPEIPTVADAGLPDLEADYWIGLFAPARMAPALVDKINRDVVGILESASMRALLLEQGAEPVSSTPGDFAAFIASETRKWRVVIQTAGIKPE
jgi:tripartite-type tricarboxylate transporter receptor subunit TctC